MVKFANLPAVPLVIHQSFVCSPRAGDSGDTAGLRYQDLTSDESRQCGGCARGLISCQYTVTLIQIRYLLYF